MSDKRQMNSETSRFDWSQWFFQINQSKHFILNWPISDVANRISLMTGRNHSNFS